MDELTLTKNALKRLARPSWYIVNSFGCIRSSFVFSYADRHQVLTYLLTLSTPPPSAVGRQQWSGCRAQSSLRPDIATDCRPPQRADRLKMKIDDVAPLIYSCIPFRSRATVAASLSGIIEIVFWFDPPRGATIEPPTDVIAGRASPPFGGATRSTASGSAV